MFWDKGGVGYLPPEMVFHNPSCAWVLHKKAVNIENSGATAGGGGLFGKARQAELMRSRVLQKPHLFSHQGDVVNSEDEEEAAPETEDATDATTAGSSKSRSCIIS